jgi:hypothetical protein
VSEGQDVQNSNWWKTNQGAGLIAVGFFSLILGYIFFYTDYDRVLRDGFLLGFFPILACCLCIGFSAIMMFDGLRNNTEASLAALDFKFCAFVIGVIAWSGLFFLALVNAGFVVTAPFYMIGLTYAMGLRPLKSCVITSLGICVVVFLIFVIINAPMPIGPEWVMEELGLPLDWGT